MSCERGRSGAPFPLPAGPDTFLSPRQRESGLVRKSSRWMCASAAWLATAVITSPGGAQTPPASNVAPTGRYPFVAADVHFMTGMIAHHAQAVVMAGWAPSHDASPSIKALCERIVVGQGDEIKLMQTWLADRHLPVPDAKSTRMHMVMDGMEHDMLMPGMLTDEEMAALDKARGREFDRLFLIGMIKHHGGAIQMVNDLLAAAGAAQDEVVFKFSTDVFADQTTEIDRMTKMLNSYQGPPR
jgi:uncharacterized protein (DUF305 family)